MSQICNECGDSVSLGSGKFINRIPSDAGKDESQQVPFPKGEWLCQECEVIVMEELN